MTTTVFTVGHGGRTTAELAGALRAAGVERIIDVRRFPGSRRYPHFGREAMARDLPAFGLAYEWRGDELGGRRKPAASSRHPAWQVEGFRAFADYMDTPAFQRAVGRLAADAEAGPPLAILCAETLWWRCHRRLIADALTLRGVTVVHVSSETSLVAHRLSAALRLDEDGRPVYDVGTIGELPIENEAVASGAAPRGRQ